MSIQLISMTLVMMLSGCAMLNNSSLQAPVAEKRPHVHEIHGDRRDDPYFWMRERDTKPVLEYLKAENEYLEAVMAPEKELRAQIYKELRGRVKEDDSSPPFKMGSYWYYTRFETGKEYPILCRKKSMDAGAVEEILVDVNQLAVGHSFFEMAEWQISPDETKLAFAVDTVGRRFYDIRFKDLRSGQFLDKQIEKVAPNMVWANDNDHIFYVRKNPDTLREESVHRYQLSRGAGEEVFFEKDEEFSVGVGRSLTDKWIKIASSATDSSEWRVLSADDPRGQFALTLAREPKHEYSIHHAGGDEPDVFYIRTNWKATNFRIVRTTLAKIGDKSSWVDFVPHDEKLFIENLLILKNQICIEERVNGLTRLRTIHRKSKKQDWIQFPDEVYTVGLGTNEDFGLEEVRFNYQSPVTPPSVFDFNFNTKKHKLVKVQDVPTYDAQLYTTKRQWAKGHDGVSIPISIVYRKDTKIDGTAPLLVYGYGSYGYSIDPGFRGSVVSLLDRGFVYAIAHVRGGQELGRKWYEDGRLMQKMNTFKDFISVTEFLIEKKWGHPKKVFAEGGSAGGLLMGAISNMRPDLYRGILSGVPFVDVLTTMLDSSIPLTTFEYTQWGNPNEKAAYEYMKQYSPYDNIQKKSYPAMLVITGYHDSQVQYWEPAKYVARLREMKTDQNLLLFKTEMEAGHGGASGRFKRLEEMALEFAFLLKVLNYPVASN